jgi:hypothetical protein
MVHTYLAVATSTLSDMDRAVCVIVFFPPPTYPILPVRRNQRNPEGQPLALPSRPRIETPGGRGVPFSSSLASPFPSFFLTLLTCAHRMNQDIPKLSLLALSLQDTSVGIGVMEVLRSCSRLREVIRVWSETEIQTATERKAGAGSIDGIIVAHEQLKADFVMAKSWLTRYAETGSVPEDSC